MADEKNTVVCYYCKQPIANSRIPVGFKLPVCESDECRWEELYPKLYG